MYTAKVHIKYFYSRKFDVRKYIVYSRCGRYSKWFDDVTEAIEYASEEYQSRKESDEFKEMLDRW